MMKHKTGESIAAASKRRIAAAGALGLLWLWGCSPEPKTAERLVIASWNVEALFDGSDGGHEYGEYTKDAGWTEEKYRARLNVIAGAVRGSGDEGLGADILALIEVENLNVLRDLAEMPGMDYRWAFFAGAPEGATGVGVLSRFPLGETRAHSAHSAAGAVPRPAAEVRVDTGAGPLVLLVCHWKSKLGGDKKTEPLRRSGAAIIARRLEELAAAEPEAPVIVLGDLNENNDEFDRIAGAWPCALLPDSAEAADLDRSRGGNRGGSRDGNHSGPLRDFLVLSGRKPPEAGFFPGVPALYSPWLEDSPFAEFGQGSYYYKDSWETIDHFLLSAALFDGRGWEYGSFRAAAEPPFTGASGTPQGYEPRTGNGLSDHLPLVLYLERAAQP
jgi:endonuclease/exonuclease/phosphatase family metal-dependent hydrolase